MLLIKTVRVCLNPVDTSFCNSESLKWLSDNDVLSDLETLKGTTLKELHQYLENIEKNKIYSWAIIINETKRHIGNIKIDPIDFKNGFAEYGIMIGDKNSWGYGYAKEASIGILNFCFYNLNLRKINLGVLKVNSRAIKLYESLGFVSEGIFKEHKKFQGGFCDEIRMAIFNDNL